MKYLRSTTSKSYTFHGMTVPAAGDIKVPFLAVGDKPYAEEWQKNRAMAALIATGAISVTEKVPTVASSNAAINSANVALKDENNSLRQQLAEAQAALAQQAKVAEDLTAVNASLKKEAASAKRKVTKLEKDIAAAGFAVKEDSEESGESGEAEGQEGE